MDTSIAFSHINENKEEETGHTTLVSPYYHSPKIFMKPTDICEALVRGEMGDAEIFSHLFTNRVVFDHGEKKWYLWNGHFWKLDKTSQVTRLVANEVAAQYNHTIVELSQQVQGVRNIEDGRVKELTRRVKSLRYRRKINNVLALATSQPDLALTGEEWGSDPMLMAVQNGVVDLTTGRLRPGIPTDYIRTVAPVMWKGIEEPAPRWELFLQEIFDGDLELVKFIRRLLGYGITGFQSEAILVVLWGEGRNGKDTLLETILHVLGQLASPIGAEVLLDSKRNLGAATPHVYALRRLRLAWVNETNENAWLNTGQVKMLTGGGTMVARPLYGNPVTFQSGHLLMLVTNKKPRASHDDYALWKRLLLVPFRLSFVDEPLEEFERKRDSDLLMKLKEEASGILAWLVRGCLIWQREGLNPPVAVREATEDYKKAEDILGQFLEECCETVPDVATTASNLYKAYSKWAEEWGLRQMSKTTFGLRLGKRFEKKRKPGDGRIQYLGIKLVTNQNITNLDSLL